MGYCALCIVLGVPGEALVEVAIRRSPETYYRVTIVITQSSIIDIVTKLNYPALN
jgi:hypothetical protein